MVTHRSNPTHGLSPSTPLPTDITVHSASRVLEIAFNDGRRFRFPFEFLRVFSPSAEVRGHGPGQERLQVGKRAVSIRSVDTVGHYAIQPIFSDGHDTGLYSWDYLYELGIHQDAMWEDYLRRLADAGASRDEGDAPAPGAPSACGSAARTGPAALPPVAAEPGVRAIVRDRGGASG
jgi:DUF971 family protein